MSLAHVVQRARVVLEVFGQLLKQQKAGLIQPHVQLGYLLIRLSAVPHIGVKGVELFDIGAKQTAHEQRIISQVFAHRTLTPETRRGVLAGSGVRLQHGLVGQGFGHAVQLTDAWRVQPVQPVGLGKVGQDLGHIGNDRPVSHAQLPKAALGIAQEKAVQLGGIGPNKAGRLG